MDVIVNKKYKRVIQLELNEISHEIISQLTANGLLPSFSYINEQWKFLQTTSETEYNHIEPWIQWVTAHTGKTLAEHELFHLSDAHKLKHPQIWETLSQHSIQSAIIGSMNATRGNTKGGIFIPDPWALHNDTFPEDLAPLWALLASKVQQHATCKKVPLSQLLQAHKICQNFGVSKKMYLRIIQQLIQQKINPKNKWKLAAIFDLFLTEIFDYILKTTDFGFYTLFLNSIAHYQHHYWRNFDSMPFSPDIKCNDIKPDHDPITYGYKIYDKILGNIIKQSDGDTLIIVLSGLSQVPYAEKESEGGMNYYRLNNHNDFAKSLGLPGEAYPMMSRDWQYRYVSKEDRENFLQVTEQLTINSEPLFKISEHTEGYFYIETAYTKGISKADIILRSKQPWVRFTQLFTNIAVKSGHHTGVGNLWISDPDAITTTGNTIPLKNIYSLGVKALTHEAPESLTSHE